MNSEKKGPSARSFLRYAVFSAFLIFPAILPALSQNETLELQQIVVRRGDTLHKIAELYLMDISRWPDIYKYNKELIRDPNYILPNMKINIPVGMIRRHLRAATLFNVVNTVRFRNSDGVWRQAFEGMALFAGYELETQANSSAHIRLATGEVARVGEKARIMLQGEKEREKISIEKGEIDASLVRVEVPDAEIIPQSSGSGHRPFFSARVEPDRKARVSVYQGAVKVVSGSITTAIQDGHAVEIYRQGRISEPQKFIPDMKDIEERLFSTKPENYFSVQISRDVTFREIMLERSGFFPMPNYEFWQIFFNKMSQKSLSARNGKGFLDKTFGNCFWHNLSDSFDALPDGEYYWRIFAFDEHGRKESLHKELVIDTLSPKLKLTSPRPKEKSVREELVFISGETDEKSDIEIKLNGASVEPRLSENTFVAVAKLVPGKNNLTVSAKDPAGNRTSIAKELDYFQE